MNCAACHTPTGTLTLCTSCAVALRIELTDVPDLLAHLDITRSRQDQIIAPHDHGPPSAETPLPYRPHIGEVVWVLHHTLLAWVTTLRGRPSDAASTAGLARWLLHHMDTIRCSLDAADLVDEVTSAIHHARHAIDRPEDRRLFLGTCHSTTVTAGTCRQEVYGLPWNRTAICPACGAEHDIAARQTWMRDVVRDYLGSPPLIAGFLRITGIQCTASMIRNYAARTRLRAAGTNDRGHALYRISDVVAVLQSRYLKLPANRVDAIVGDDTQGLRAVERSGAVPLAS